jgi:hypothetical protein
MHTWRSWRRRDRHPELWDETDVLWARPASDVLGSGARCGRWWRGERPIGLPRLALGGEPLGYHGRREEGSRQATVAGGGVGRGVAGLPRPS